MAQANPNTGGPQPASYQELYAWMPDVLNSVYMTFLTPGEQEVTGKIDFWKNIDLRIPNKRDPKYTVLLYISY
jgi:hypothetical protein